MNKTNPFRLDVSECLPDPKSGHYWMGSGLLGAAPINSSGDWFLSLPPMIQQDFQSDQFFDAEDCTVYGTDHSVVTLMNFIFKIQARYSERYTGILSNITPTGGNPHIVAETIRTQGVIPYEDLPFDSTIDSWDKYYSPKPMTDNLLLEGQNWLTAYKFGHEWVYTSVLPITQQQAAITQALKSSPVGMSVSAWYEDGQGGYNQPVGAVENHWVCCFKEDMTYYYIFDSYNNTIKKYNKNSKITLCKLYTIAPAPSAEQQYSNFYKYFDWLYNILKSLGLMNNQSETSVTVSAFCLAIQKHEGWSANPPSRSYINNNPGNLKYSSVDSHVTAFTNQQDENGFAKFKCYEDGFTCLKNKTIAAATGKSTVYLPTDTLKTFFQKYAPVYDNNNPDAYAKDVASQLLVDENFQIKNLIIS